MTTVAAWLQQATRQLAAAAIATARLDSLVLLEDVTAHNRSWLLAHQTTNLKPAQLTQLAKLLDQRAQHIPLAYVRGKTEFYGREFVITPAVLEPRPESETMITLLKELVVSHQPGRPVGQTDGSSVISRAAEDRQLKTEDYQPKLVDVGTGSGALGITAALEISNSGVVLVDIDEKALEVAEQNANRFELDLPCIVDDLLSHAGKRSVMIDIILANLPYVPDNYQINTAALHEPRLAIFGGADGLDLYRRLFEQVANLLQKPVYILTESLPFQHEALASIAQTAGYSELQSADFIQLFGPANTTVTASQRAIISRNEVSQKTVQTT